MKLQKLNRIAAFAVAVLLVLGPLAAALTAQTAELPRRTEPLSWDSGIHNGRGNPHDDGVEDATLAVSDVLEIPGVPWMQLEFRNGNLGNKSRIEITSLLDGSTQVLDRESFREWNGRSAYFNGDAIEIRLYVGPQDRGARVMVKSAVVGEWAVPGQKSICGVDNRYDSTDSRVGRIDPIGCTGWMINNGKLLTAGHCLAGSGNTTLSIQPPKSLSNGTVQFPPADRQYSIIGSSFDYVNGGVGNDWGIFAVNDNSVTGLQPHAAHGSFAFRQDLGPSTIRITGFGVDDGVDNQSLQTHTGSNMGSSGTTMRYNADTTGGNSGSPVIDEATGEAVGIHTHGGCTSSGGNNSGTSFFNSAAWSAINAGGGGGSGPGDPGCPAGTIDLNTLTFTSYADQNVSNTSAIGDGGDSIQLTNNTWLRTTQTWNVTANTVIDFKFASANQGEIHAIGFDENDTLNDNPRHFQFWGTQNWTGAGAIDHNPKYSGGGSYQSYSIPVGQSYTGNMYLVLTNDNDAGSGNEGYFACVDIYETGGGGGGCDVEESFESGGGGWTGSGNCTTGSFVVGTPDGVNNGGVQTQVSGAQDGTQAIFSASNAGGAGSDDIDGGECVATSPVYNVTTASNVVAWYFHGQRDAGDDPSGDYFRLEVSINGGAWTSIASYNDVTVNAAWTQATTTASAGDTVRLRVRASDGAAAGDLVEAGIDNVSICPQ